MTILNRYNLLHEAFMEQKKEISRLKAERDNLYKVIVDMRLLLENNRLGSV